MTRNDGSTELVVSCSDRSRGGTADGGLVDDGGEGDGGELAGEGEGMVAVLIVEGEGTVNSLSF